MTFQIIRHCYPCGVEYVPLVEVYLYGHTFLTCWNCATESAAGVGFFPHAAGERALEDFARREVSV